jgi:peptidoglycan-associated lipoprotein
MSAQRLSLACSVAAMVLATACSHQQKVATATPPAQADAGRTKARPAPRAAAAPTPAAPVASGPRNQEDSIYFDFDSAVLRDDARPVLQKVAGTARTREANLRVEGNCDELGTVEYNLALGEHRARAARDYLVNMGVPADRIATVSYGSQHPRDPGHDEQAHAKNRRDDLELTFR